MAKKELIFKEDVEKKLKKSLGRPIFLFLGFAVFIIAIMVFLTPRFSPFETVREVAREAN